MKKLQAYIDRVHGGDVEAFGKAIKVTRQAVYRYLNGRIPKPGVLQRITIVTKSEISAQDFYIVHTPHTAPALPEQAITNGGGI